MKKIGIITLYYKSKNYGGNLQAYALCRFLTKYGYDAEQISFQRILISPKSNKLKSLFSKNVFRICFRKISSIVRGFYINRENKKHSIYERREKAFIRFNQELIPHSETVYNSKTISECVDNYDAFITGSDQVWNFWGETHIYLLDFVPSSKVKLSYAASIARDALTEDQKALFRETLKDYKAISVREQGAKNLLTDLAPMTPQVVLDPTLLLSREDWDTVCADPVVEGDYIFCYFLGDNKNERKCAREFAKAHGLKIVALPHTAGIWLMDRKFGDMQLYDTSPEEFISLIKHAKYIFTDSFHAVVFSNIFGKQYFVFNRTKNGDMSSRIFNITKMFFQEDRFCFGKERENLGYISSLSDIDYARDNKAFEDCKNESIQFLLGNLKD